MPRVIPGFPADPAHRLTVDVDGAGPVILRYRYNARLASWYVDLFAADGSPIVLGRRLSPASRPWADLARTVPARVIVEGSDGYAREALGVDLALVSYSAAEVAAVAPAAVVLPVSVP